MGPSCLDVSRAASSFKSGKDLGGQNFDGEGIEAGDLGHDVGGHVHGLRDIQTQVLHFSHCIECFQNLENS